MNNMVIIGDINPFGLKVGGTGYYILNFLNAVNSNENVLLYGYTTANNVNKQIKNNIKFRPLLVYKEEKKRYRLPQTFKFIFKIYENRKEILSMGRVFHIQRIDHAIPFLFPSKKGKIVVYFHGTASKGHLTGKGMMSKLKGCIYLILEYLILPKADKIVTVSRKDECFYIDKYPETTNKIVTIPTPIDLDVFKIKTDKKALRSKYGLDEKHKIILYAGRFSKVKGIDLIIEAFVNLNQELPGSDLILVGQGEEEKRLRKLVYDLKANNIKFLGPLNHEEMPNILNCADVLIMASITEGMPTIILEALACGLPVVSTNVGDINTVIKNEKIGFLVEQPNKEELINNMIKALKISDKFKEERVNIAQNFSAHTLSKMILEMHKNLLA